MAGTVIAGGDVPSRSVAGTASLRPQLELAVEGIDGVRLAAAVGADRIELCTALAETEGVTPSIGMVEQACGMGVPVHVLVRPRPGGFTYSQDELEVIHRDVAAALEAGASGVVIGILAADGGPDEAAVLRIAGLVRQLKPGADVTFHRAFDAALAAGTDPAEALARLERAGVDRVLTSGGYPDCGAGLKMLARLVELGRTFAPSVQIMAGGGVVLDLVPALLASGVHAVHTSARGDRARSVDPVLAAHMAAAVATGGARHE